MWIAVATQVTEIQVCSHVEHPLNQQNKKDSSNEPIGNNIFHQPLTQQGADFCIRDNVSIVTAQSHSGRRLIPSETMLSPGNLDEIKERISKNEESKYRIPIIFRL